MKNVLLLSIILLCLSLQAFGQGIDFQKMTIDQAFEKAKADKKGVMMVIFADGHAASEEMDKLYQSADFGKPINEKFVSIKVDDHIYHETNISKDYPTARFPSIFFFDANKKLHGKFDEVKEGATKVNKKGFMEALEEGKSAIK